jgi:hypothetical protein
MYKRRKLPAPLPVRSSCDAGLPARAARMFARGKEQIRWGRLNLAEELMRMLFCGFAV